MLKETRNGWVWVNIILCCFPTGSQEEWNRQRTAIENQKTALINQVLQLINGAIQTDSWFDDETQKVFSGLESQIDGLNSTLDNLDVLEKSTQTYSLSAGRGEQGGTTYDPQTGNIIFSFNNTANFIHETTHGGQFERGEFAFDRVTGMPYGQDVYDEVAAYKAQFAYDPSSVSGLRSSIVANSLNAITTVWVQELTKSDGEKVYAPGGAANTGVAPVDMNTKRNGLINAYPHLAETLRAYPVDFTLKDIPTIFFKR